MNNSVKNPINISMNYLLCLSIMILPLNFVPWFSNILGELGEKGSLYPFYLMIILMFFLTLQTKKLYIIKDKTIQLLITFYIITFTSIIFNIVNILNNVFKGRTGVEKLTTQSTILLLMIVVFYISYYTLLTNKIGFKKIRKLVLVSFIICGIYSLTEILTLSGLIDFSNIIKSVSNIVHLYNRGEVYTRGIRSLSGEASAFGLYLSFALPWIFSYIFTERKSYKYMLIFIYLFILAMLTKSRFTLVVINLQIVVFLYLYIIKMKTNRNKGSVAIKCSTVILIGIVTVGGVYSSIGKDQFGFSVEKFSIKNVLESLTDDKNYSNIARFGMMKSALKMGIENPILGVGLGQFGFYANEYVDNKSRESSEIVRWLDDNQDRWPPTFSIYLRILAEQGILALITWIYLWVSITKRVYKKWKNMQDDYEGICIIVTILGMLISSFNMDTYAYIPYWLIISLSIIYLKSDKLKYKNT